MTTATEPPVALSEGRPEAPTTRGASGDDRQRARTIALFVVLGIALVVFVVLAAGRGQLAIPADEVFGSLMHRLGLDVGPMPAHPQGDNTLWQVRFPRVVMAIVVGASLSTAGALMQGVFGNPLAEPGVVGVSIGAALASAFAIVFQVTIFGAWTVAVFAFVGGLITTLLVYTLSRAEGRTEVVTLVLMGIAVNAVCAAGLAFMLFVADTQAREEIVIWQLGSLNGTRWQYVAIVGPLCAAGIAGALVASRKLDVLALGDRAARHVGVNVERLRLGVIGLVALLTAAGVAFAGIIAFVGLIVPHLVRIVVGPSHRVLIPASALGGAVLLLAADLFARTLVQGADLPIGMLTALIGGPFFFWLLYRTRRAAGGWA
jgi:iron complex transport system permease protein